VLSIYNVKTAVSAARVDPEQLNNEGVTNEASRFKLRLHRDRFPVGVTVAVFCLWQDCNHEALYPRCDLRR
jgi:hypothetical protein